MVRPGTKAFPESLEPGLAALRRRAFFEAHELFEEVFRRAHADERLLAHGLAQLAAAHHQLSLGRARASASTWRKAASKLRAAAFPIDTLTTAMERFHASLGITPEAPRFIDLDRLPPPHEWPVP